MDKTILTEEELNKKINIFILILICLFFCTLIFAVFYNKYYKKTLPFQYSKDFTIEYKGDYYLVKIEDIDQEFRVDSVEIGDECYVKYKYFENIKPHPIYEDVQVVITPEKAEGFTILTVKNDI